MEILQMHSPRGHWRPIEILQLTKVQTVTYDNLQSQLEINMHHRRRAMQHRQATCNAGWELSGGGGFNPPVNVFNPPSCASLPVLGGQK